MTFSGFAVQFLNGLADASSLFLVAVGLSVIFGVTRIVNFAHGSLYMLGAYLAYTITAYMSAHGVMGFWLGIFTSALVVAALGVLVEVFLLRRIYAAPELFQLLATFALVLIVNDLVLWIWGPEDLLGPLAPGLSDSVSVLGRYVPQYDLLLMLLGPVVLLVLRYLINSTQWGALLRAATQDRAMLSALGVNQALLFTLVFALGSFLAGLGGALQLPRQPANLGMDLNIIAEAFVVVVVGGMGSIHGAYVAALLIAQIKAFCIALGTVSIAGLSLHFPSMTLVAEFLLMAVVLVFRPWGLFGRKPSDPQESHHIHGLSERAKRVYMNCAILLLFVFALLPALSNTWPYVPVLALDMSLAALFAASLFILMGPGGMYSFGHAAYFGLGAYGAAILYKTFGFSMLASMLGGPLVATVAALVFGWFCVRLSGVYLAMLTLAFAQIVWSIVYQWDSFTGGSNGIIGIWPNSIFSGHLYYYLVLAVVAALLLIIYLLTKTSFGYAIRAIRDSAYRSSAIGLKVSRIQWSLFILSGAIAGASGALFVFAKGSVSPEVLAISKSVDGLLMVLLGGLDSLAGPVIGALTLQLMEDFFTGITEYWHAVFGMVIITLVVIFPGGIVRTLQKQDTQ